MQDTLRPSTEEFCAIYEKGYHTWLDLYKRALEEPSLSQHCFGIQDVFKQLPCFPPDPKLKPVTFPGHSFLYATGTSTWKTSQGTCEIPSIELDHDILVGVHRSTSLSLSSLSYDSWFEGNDNHLSVLILAWAYILSARWVELMPEPCTLEYTRSEGQWKKNETDHQNQVVVELGDIDNEAARWWAAVLAPGEGWCAKVTLPIGNFRSPWSTYLHSTPNLTLSRKVKSLPPPLSPVSFIAATNFLSDYCDLHNIADQNHAALAAALYLPFLNGKGDIQLPLPFFSHKKGLSAVSASGDLAWVHKSHRFDQLLTLSCDTSGIRPLLSSVFFEPGIACNVVSPWLQSAFVTINLVLDNPRMLAHIMMGRVPKLAFLWLGGIIMGVQKDILQLGRFGVMPIELHAAAWSDTIQSFIQEPVSEHPARNGVIQRSDECRLLFLVQADGYNRVPICPWEPFKATALEETNIEVRVHADCKGHSLRYAGWKWYCNNGREIYQKLDITRTQPSKPHTTAYPRICVTPNLLDEIASATATRSIFSWLRSEGYPRGEQEIKNHEWVAIYDSDNEESDCQDSDSISSRKASPLDVKSWVKASASGDFEGT